MVRIVENGLTVLIIQIQKGHMAAIPSEARHLFEGKDIAHLATINPDGSPQVSPVWIGLDEDVVIVNTNEGLVKTRNMRTDPKVALSISGRSNPYESLDIQGTVDEISGDGAESGMDTMTKRYLGVDVFPYRRPGDIRVIVKIRPDKVHYRNVPDGDSRDGSAVLQLHRDQLRHLLEKNMDAWVDTFAEDAVFELPFAPPNYPQRLEGKAAIYDYVKDYAKHIDLQRFNEVVVHPTRDPAVLLVEAEVEGRVVATGQPYQVRYVWVITEAAGKIVRQRDYWNPLAVVDALGGADEMRSTFNVIK